MIRLLLVEDDQVDQMSFKRMVKNSNLDYQFDIASSIVEAKVYLEEKNYDIVLTDYNLGDGNAFEIFKDLQNTPFIFTTGGGDEEIAVEALRAGAFDYLIKDKERNYLHILPLTIEKAIERKKIQQQLKLMEAIIINANDAVLVLEWSTLEDIRITFTNEETLKLSGYTKEEISQKIPFFLLKKDYQNEEVSAIVTSLYNHKAIRSELLAMDKNGNEYWVEANFVPLEKSFSVKNTVVAVIRDITQRKKVEEQLLLAKQTAESARNAEKQFLANMSHEIRTPMNSVIGMTQLLLESKPSEKQKEYLNSLKFSTDSLLSLINDILDFSKIESGRMEFEKIEFNIIELIQSIQKAVRFKLKDKKNLIITTNIDYNITTNMLGDSMRLNQILTNLLGNAGKFTELGEINLSVKILEKNTEKYILEFQVSDTGIGIEATRLGDIFDKFRQASESITRNYGGTGLGLSIVKQLIELQGGQIKVESEIGKGTVFTFQIPYENSGAPLSTEDPFKDNMENENQLSMSEVNFLVVEDNLMNQKLIRLIMEKWNATFSIANHGKEALQLLKNENYDLILMDLQMPIMDGYDTTAAIRNDKNSKDANIPIIALTAAALIDEKRKAFEYGMNEFLTKPFTPNKLRKVVRKLLSDVNTTEEKNTILEKSHPFHLKAFDFSYLKDTFGDSKELIVEMVDIFLNQNPIELKKLNNDYTNGDFESAQKTAHKIKSNYMMLGMEEQRNIAFEIESGLKEVDFDKTLFENKVKHLIHSTNSIYPKLKEAIESM